jgi:tRNA-splicing ligase RtcB (3'-phosphate/5'-hydroxy nucleic acid ligase)
MSFIQQVTKISGGHYTLPRVGKMRTDVHAFIDDALFALTDEKIWQQAANAATTYPNVRGVYLMPDTHFGYHAPIGSVVVTDDIIAQGSVGYDISCGVLLAKIEGLHARDVVSPEIRLRWIRGVEERVALGIGSHRPTLAPEMSGIAVEELCLHGAEPLGIKPDYCERVSLPVQESHDPRWLENAWSKAAPQMGSLGGGNHFIEMQVEPTTGDVFVQIHCGSRGYGWQIANWFFYEGSRLRGLQPRRREESWLDINEPLGKQFWAAHNAAGNYAIANRWTIFQGINTVCEEVFGRSLTPIYEISHNLSQQEIGVDGDEVLVNRKGATRAFPAGHPQLHNTKWESTGHPCLIPGSMLSGAAVLMPKVDANKSGYSVNHGAGRLLGRGQAKRELVDLHEMIDDEMGQKVQVFDYVEIEGIILNTEQAPLDECGYAYKDLDDVLHVLEVEEIAEVKHRMLPIANIKGV